MADSTKIPVINEAADRDALIGSAADDAAQASVPDRPGWMKGDSVKASRDRRSRPAAELSRPLIAPVPAAGGKQGLASSLKVPIVAWLTSVDAKGFSTSLLLHTLLLFAMALWILPRFKESTRITTVVDSEVEAPQPFDAMDDVQLDSPTGSEDIVVPQLAEVVPQNAQLDVLEQQFLQDVTAADMRGEGGSSDVGSGGFRLLEPKNAVKAGSFTAWTIPIGGRYGEQTKAGDSPRPGQDYHIVIQVKVSGRRNVYNISDLSGRVIGSDGYVQVIPAQAFTQHEDGHLVRAKVGRRLPIVDGVVQILIRVPGAQALVKDTIQINSKLLKERQKLELVFGQ